MTSQETSTGVHTEAAGPLPAAAVPVQMAEALGATPGQEQGWGGGAQGCGEKVRQVAIPQASWIPEEDLSEKGSK